MVVDWSFLAIPFPSFSEVWGWSRDCFFFFFLHRKPWVKSVGLHGNSRPYSSHLKSCLPELTEVLPGHALGCRTRGVRARASSSLLEHSDTMICVSALFIISF